APRSRVGWCGRGRGRRCWTCPSRCGTFRSRPRACRRASRRCGTRICRAADGGGLRHAGGRCPRRGECHQPVRRRSPMIRGGENRTIVIEEVTDPVELAKARAQDERFDRNWEWFKAHAPEIYRTHRGKILCVAGQELFVGDTPEEVLARARAAHPED